MLNAVVSMRETLRCVTRVSDGTSYLDFDRTWYVCLEPVLYFLLDSRALWMFSFFLHKCVVVLLVFFLSLSYHIAYIDHLVFSAKAGLVLVHGANSSFSNVRQPFSFYLEFHALTQAI